MTAKYHTDDEGNSILVSGYAGLTERLFSRGASFGKTNQRTRAQRKTARETTAPHRAQAPIRDQTRERFRPRRDEAGAAAGTNPQYRVSGRRPRRCRRIVRPLITCVRERLFRGQPQLVTRRTLTLSTPYRRAPIVTAFQSVEAGTDGNNTTRVYRSDEGFVRRLIEPLFDKLPLHRTPDVIASPRTEVEVVDLMREASQQGWKVAVRSGGHSWIASSVRSGGLLLDMSAFNSISIDATTRTAKVGPAVRSAELVKALASPRTCLSSGSSRHSGNWRLSAGRRHRLELGPLEAGVLLGSERSRRHGRRRAGGGVGIGEF